MLIYFFNITTFFVNVKLWTQWSPPAPRSKPAAPTQVDERQSNRTILLKHFSGIEQDEILLLTSRCSLSNRLTELKAELCESFILNEKLLSIAAAAFIYQTKCFNNLLKLWQGVKLCSTILGSYIAVTSLCKCDMISYCIKIIFTDKAKIYEHK